MAEEGLSTGIGQGYAQVLSPTDTSMIFKRAMQMQDTAAKMKIATAEKKAKAKSDFLGDIKDESPKGWLPAHKSEIERLNLEKQQALKKLYESDSTDKTSPEYQDFLTKSQNLNGFAEQSKNYREALEPLTKEIAKNSGKFSNSSLNYLQNLQKGYNEDGTPNFTIDASRIIERPDYSKDMNNPEIIRLLKPSKSSIGEAELKETGESGILKSVQSFQESLPQENIDAAKEIYWNSKDGVEKHKILVDFAENFEDGNKDYQQFSDLVTVDESGNKDYSVAAEAFAKNRFNVPVINKRTTKTSYVKEPGYRGSRGNEYDYQSEIVTNTKPVPTKFFDKSGKSKDRGYTWYNALKEDGSVRKIIKNDVTGEFHSFDEDGSVSKEPISKDIMKKYTNLEPQVINQEEEVETVSGPQKNIKFSADYVINEDGSVSNTKLEQGIGLVPESFKIANYNKQTKSFDDRGGEDTELGFFMTGTDKRGELKTIPVDEVNIETLKKSTKFEPELWDKYQNLKGSKSKSSAKKETKTETPEEKAARERREKYARKK